jgi:hypothetical protein
MNIISVLIVLTIIGFGLWLINTHIPMARPFKVAINVIVCLMLLIWLLNIFGLVNIPINSHRLHCG